MKQDRAFTQKRTRKIPIIQGGILFQAISPRGPSHRSMDCFQPWEWQYERFNVVPSKVTCNRYCRILLLHLCLIQMYILGVFSGGGTRGWNGCAELGTRSGTFPSSDCSRILFKKQSIWKRITSKWCALRLALLTLQFLHKQIYFYKVYIRQCFATK
jgi:hypothetical protein